MRANVFLLSLMLLLSVLFACSSDTPENIIIVIGDGAGFYQMQAASSYIYGETDSLISQSFPVQLACTTYPATGHGYDSEMAWSEFDYVMKKCTDSAASGTALACGVKTNNGAIGVDQEKNVLINLMEQAEQLGKMTGIVTSVPITHATPAAFVAHNDSRHNYHEIAREMILESAVDVIMGAGHPFFDNNGNRLNEPDYQYLSESLWNTVNSDSADESSPHKWGLVQDRDAFKKLMNGATPERVLGLAPVASSLQVSRDGGEEQKEPFGVPLISTVPTLEEMTRGAINVLDDDPDGFVLMVEAGAIDWACHGNNGPRMIEEFVQMEETVNAIVDWIESESSWKNTLLVVTADHETGYLTGPGSGEDDPVWTPIVNNGKNKMPGMEWHSGSHTNSLVPLQAIGKGADNFKLVAVKKDSVRGSYLDNTDIGIILKSLATN
ncbi:MAG: alkaline phosphatase [candidate division KSB1 bacterium]|nr:alkaline phosphatase [candidate division KSB1 bacterium]